MTRRQPPATKPLTAQQQLFVDALLSDPAMTQAEAARRAGYKGTASREAGRALMAKPHVRAAVERGRAALRRRFQVDAEQVLRELARLADSDITVFFDGAGTVRPMRDWPIAARRAVQSIKFARGGQLIDLKLHSKTDALDKLMRHLGLYLDVNYPIDPKQLTEDQLERIANGEHPLRVLAGPGAG